MIVRRAAWSFSIAKVSSSDLGSGTPLVPCANAPGHQQGEFACAQALADESGGIWIATVRDNLDRDLTIRATGEACMCMATLAADGSASAASCSTLR